MHEPNGSEMTDGEARLELLDLAHGKTGAVPAEVLVEHVMAVVASGDWPVRLEAMRAVLRRCAFGKRDGLQVFARPAGGRPLGIYRTGRNGASTRPYRTLIAGVQPIGVSCDCADFLRNSLGLCKHSLAALNDLYGRPSALRQALPLQATGALFRQPTIFWDPIRPLIGAGDWLGRIVLHRVTRAGNNGGRAPALVTHLFGAGAEGGQLLRHTHADDPVKRLRVVEELLDLIGAGRRTRVPALGTVPAVPALLAAERMRLQHLTANRLTHREIERAISTMRHKPYAYQREGVERFLRQGRLLLADDMGLGKTAQAIAACHVLWETERIQRGLLIVPASLKPQWLHEWSWFSPTPIAAVDGSPAERVATYRGLERGYLLINYEQLLRDFEAIATWNPEIVILDEAQRIKNWATKSAAHVKRLQPRYRLVLSGTPMENRIDELASIYDWVDSFALEPKWRLTPWHVTPVDGVKEIGGARNLDTLRLRLAPTMLRRTRQEVLDQLPARTDTVVPVDMTAAQLEEHDALIRPIASLIQRGRRRPLTQAEFLKLMQLLTTQRIIANGLAQLRFAEIWPALAGAPPDRARIESLATPKLFELRELLEHVVLEQGRKVVVFSQWRRMLELACWATRDVLDRGGRRAVFFTGQEGRARRTQNLIELHDDPAAAVLFASDAGGVGLNLQKAASCCINIDLPWNPAVLEQRIGRIYRLGQKRPIDVYNLVSQGSIEARIASLVADKKALFASLFDGSSDEARFERSGSFLTQLERVVEPAVAAEPEDDLHQEETPLAREIESIVAAADESTDPAPPPAAEPVASAHAARPSSDPVPVTAAIDLQQLFATLRIRTTAEGGIAIEAPPEAASTLAAVFEGLARQLRTTSPTRVD
jgi:superfamily II DNA or RNA helicase